MGATHFLMKTLHGLRRDGPTRPGLQHEAVHKHHGSDPLGGIEGGNLANTPPALIVAHLRHFDHDQDLSGHPAATHAARVRLQGCSHGRAPSSDYAVHQGSGLCRALARSTRNHRLSCCGAILAQSSLCQGVASMAEGCAPLPHRRMFTCGHLLLMDSLACGL